MDDILRSYSIRSYFPCNFYCERLHLDSQIPSFFLRNKQKALENAQICAYLCLKWLRLITPYFSMFLIIGTYFCKITVTSDVFIIFWHDKRTLHRSITWCDSDKTTTKIHTKKNQIRSTYYRFNFSNQSNDFFLLTVQYQRRIYSNVINFDQSIYYKRIAKNR